MGVGVGVEVGVAGEDQRTQAEVTGIGNILVATAGGDMGEYERSSIGRGKKGKRCSQSASASACGTSNSATSRSALVASSAGLVRLNTAVVAPGQDRLDA